MDSEEKKLCYIYSTLHFTILFKKIYYCLANCPESLHCSRVYILTSLVIYTSVSRFCPIPYLNVIAKYYGF